MLNNKILNIPVWLWISIIIALLLICMQMKTNNSNKPKEGFADETAPSKTVEIFNFNTDWCGWSQKLQPEWDEFTKMVSLDNSLKHVAIRDIKCDKKGPEGEDMCNSKEFSVPGFPYIIAKVDGRVLSNPYTGERTANALLAYAKSL